MCMLDLNITFQDEEEEEGEQQEEGWRGVGEEEAKIITQSSNVRLSNPPARSV